MPISNFPQSVILGNHAYFVLDGSAYTIPTSGTSGRAAKPGASDTSWADLGIIAELDVEPKTGVKDEIFAPAPGKIVKYDEVASKHEIDVTIKLEQVTLFALQLLFKTANLSGSSNVQFNQIAATNMPFKGWLKVEKYDQGDNQFLTFDQYGVFELKSAVKFDDKHAQFELEVRGLWSTLNTGNIN